MLAGHPPGFLDTLDMGDTLDLLLAVMLEELRAGTKFTIEAVRDRLEQPPFNMRASWGTTPAAVAGQRAMMDMAGGPAPMRQDGARKPAPRPARPAPRQAARHQGR